MARALLTIWLALAVLLTGCDPNGSSGSSGQKISAATPSYELLESAVRRRARLASVKATAAMRIYDKGNDFGLRINTKIMAASPASLRIIASKALGNIDVFDAVVIKDDIGFYVPSKKTLYQGQLTDLEKADVYFRPDEILNNLLRPETGLLLKTWKPAQAYNRGALVVIEEEAENGKKRLRVTLDGNTGDISAVETLDADGQVAFIRSAGRYKEVASLSAGRESGKMFPYWLKLEWPKEQRFVEISFKTMETDQELPADAFELEIGGKYRTKAISDIEVDSDKPEAAAGK
jgi:hypothetical protein